MKSNLRSTLAIVAASLSLVILSGCGSLGSVLGGGGNQYPSNGPSNYPSSQGSTVQGTVSYVDTQAQRIDLDSGYSSGRRNTTSIYYDSRTTVSYQNQRGAPSNLERGDQVDVRVYDSGNGRYLADSITVTQSVSSNGSPNGNYPNGNPNNYPPNNYPSTQSGDIEGTVSTVDTRAQRIDVTVSNMTGLRNSSRTASIYYDARTRVVYQNQSYQPADLERGDQIDIRVSSDRNGQYLADTITVLRSIRQ